MEPVLNPKKQLIVRIISYVAAIIAIGVLTGILLFFLVGYRYSDSVGGFQQGGLVQFISRPSDARITIGSAKLSRTTRTKITMLPGDYLVKMEKDKYQTWQKNVSVRAGEVLWLDSARLIPRDIQSQIVKNYPQISSVAVRSSRDRLAVLPSPTKPTIELFEMNATSPEPKTITLSQQTYTNGKKHNFSLVGWSPNGRYLLLSHQAAKKFELLVVNTSSPDETRLIKQKKAVDLSNIVFDPFDNDRLLVRASDKALRAYEITSENEQTEIAKNVENFSLFEGGVLYVESKSKTKQIRYRTDGEATSRLVKEFPRTAKVRATLAAYNGKKYFVISANKKTTIYKVDGIDASDLATPLKLVEYEMIRTKTAPQQLFTKKNGQLLVVVHGSSVSSYNFELDNLSKVSLAKGTNLAELEQRWFDEYHFWVHENGSIRMYEYDGSNAFDIATASEGYPAAMSQNEKFVYSITKHKNTTQLHRSTIRL